MLYLVIARSKDLFPPLENWPGIANNGLQTMEYLKDLEAKGKVKSSGPFVSEWGGFMVLDVDNHDEVTEITVNCPGTVGMKWEVHPIASWEGVAKALTKWGDNAKERLARRQQSHQQGQKPQ